MESPFSDHFVAVRSSGTDEDSASHSFAGMKMFFLKPMLLVCYCRAV